MLKKILFVLSLFTISSNSFMITKSKSFEIVRNTHTHRLHNLPSRCSSFQMKNNNHDYDNNKNSTKITTKKSKVYKMDFTHKYDDNNDDWLFEPRYAFGLSEFNMIFIRIYVYSAITCNIILQLLHNQK